MGIKTVKYNANSIIYFKGDTPNRVYILKKGSIVTKSSDLRTGEDMLTMIKVGEFIGVKNVISNQPYSETVSTLTDSELIVFYKEDFENFILSNNRIMMQTLVVFSNQLRKIHNDIKEINDFSEHVKSSENKDKDLYELGLYFKNSGKIEYSNYCFKKYKELYPDGKYLDSIKSGISYKSNDIVEEDKSLDNEDTALYFQEGQNYLAENNFIKASECFKKIIDTNGYHYVDALYFNGAALFKLKKYKECIYNYSNFLSKHKDYKKIIEVLYYLGISYKEIGDIKQASRFLKEVVKRADSTPIAKLAHDALKEI